MTMWPHGRLHHGEPKKGDRKAKSQDKKLKGQEDEPKANPKEEKGGMCCTFL